MSNCEMEPTKIQLLESKIADQSKEYKKLERQIEGINKIRPNCALVEKLTRKKDLLTEELEKLGRLLQTYKEEVTDQMPNIQEDLEIAEANITDYYTLLDEATTRPAVDDALANIDYWKGEKKENTEKENG